MPGCRPLAALTLIIALALPSASLADSAGDNQYQDPFANSPKQTTPKASPAPTQSSSTQPSSTQSSSTQSAPTQSGTTQSAATASAPATTQPQAVVGSATTVSQSRQLPCTGLDLRLAAGVGIFLVACGLLLRRRLAD
jgi:hypothetical protein